MKSIIFLSLVFSVFGAVVVQAEEPLCNELLSGLSSDLKASIHELAKLRYDLDQRFAKGIDDGLTRSLKLAFEQKLTEISRSSNLSREVLLATIRSEIQNLQARGAVDTQQTAQVKGVELKRLESIKAGELLASELGWPHLPLANGRFITIGGGSQDIHRSEIHAFDLQTPSGEKLGNMLLKRLVSGHSVSADGRIWISGGSVEAGSRLSIERFDPKTGTSEHMGDLLEERSVHTQTELSNGDLLVVGGYNSMGWPMASIERFSINTRKSEKVGELIEARCDHAQVELTDGRILVSGGEDSETTPLSSIETFHPDSRVVKQVGDLVEARRSHAQSVLEDGRILVSGGMSGDEGYYKIASIEVFDLATGKSEEIGNLLQARSHHIQWTLPNGKILIVGGFGFEGPVSTIEVFDLNTRESQVIGDLNDLDYVAKWLHAQGI